MKDANIAAPGPVVDRRVQELRDHLSRHPVYDDLRTVEDLRFFMERHVIAVWDFMSLLKSLQMDLTDISWPWRPPAERQAARLINEIVLGEESDEIAPGIFSSHFEWYLEAMDEVGADRGPIDRLLSALGGGVHWSKALQSSGLPEEAVEFAVTTLRLAAGPIHVRAAAFFYGREDLIPHMFVELVRRLRADGHPCETLNAYLDRHIEVDGGEHGPMALKLLDRLVGSNPTRIAEAREAALIALRSRHRLWTSIHEGVTDDTSDLSPHAQPRRLERVGSKPPESRNET